MLLYVKPPLHPQVITKPQISNADIKYVQILSGSEKLILALVYRPPAQNSNVDNDLYEQISDICNHNDAIIFGDFNLPVTVWGGTLNSHSGHELYSNILESSLYQHIYEPTRGESILDIVLSTNDSQINNVDIGSEFSTSDHKSVFFTIECNTGVHNNSYEKVPDFRRADFDKLKKFLKIPTGQKFTESRMLSKLGTCSLIYSEMPLQNAFQCVIGGQQIIVNPNGGILTSEIFY